MWDSGGERVERERGSVRFRHICLSTFQITRFKKSREISKKKALLLVLISLLNRWISYPNMMKDRHYQVGRVQYFSF